MTRTVERTPGPRWLLPAEDDLIRAIGRAVYSFAQLERSVERAREALAGSNAGRANGHAAGELGAQLSHILGRYRELKERRDGLLRGEGGGAGRSGLDSGPAACAWSTEDILRVARESEAAAIEANRLLRKHL
jgi:hypothetical protein